MRDTLSLCCQHSMFKVVKTIDYQCKWLKILSWSDGNAIHVSVENNGASKAIFLALTLCAVYFVFGVGIGQSILEADLYISAMNAARTERSRISKYLPWRTISLSFSFVVHTPYHAKMASLKNMGKGSCLTLTVCQMWGVLVLWFALCHLFSC